MKLKFWKRNKKSEYLTDEDIKSLGFKETSTKGHLSTFRKGLMSIKWDFHITHRVITIKWGKSMRFFGIVETKDELKRIINNINKYFGNSNR